MLEYYAELSVQTTKEELEQRINDYLLSDGYKRADSKRNKRYVRDYVKSVRNAQRFELLFAGNRNTEPNIEVGRWKGKIRLFYKYRLTGKIFLYWSVALCLFMQIFLFAKAFEMAKDFNILMLIPTFALGGIMLLSSLSLFITSNVRLRELLRAIGYEEKAKLKIKTLKQS